MAAILAFVLAGYGVLNASVNRAWAEPIRILAMGDSLMAGYNLPQGISVPARLQQQLTAHGYEVTVLQGGVSGDTSAGGVARLNWSLSAKPDIAILALGANDALRGLPPAQTKDNLAKILDALKARKIKVLLAGMLAPPNMGSDYAKAFNGLYPELAKRYDVAYEPFFLAGVAANVALLQEDGMHPTAAGVDEIVARILPSVAKLVNEVLEGRMQALDAPGGEAKSSQAPASSAEAMPKSADKP